MRRTTIRHWAAMALLVGLIVALGAAGAFGEEFLEPRTPPPNPVNVAADTLIMRPVGLIMIPVAGLVYAIGYPFARAAGNEPEVYRSLLGDTIDFTFRRPLGRGEPFD